MPLPRRTAGTAGVLLTGLATVLGAPDAGAVPAPTARAAPPPTTWLIGASTLPAVSPYDGG